MCTVLPSTENFIFLLLPSCPEQFWRKGNWIAARLPPTMFHKCKIPGLLHSPPFSSRTIFPIATSRAHHLAMYYFMLWHHSLPAQQNRYFGHFISQLLSSFKRKQLACRPHGCASSRPPGEEIKKSLNASLLTPVPAKSIKRNHQSSLGLPEFFSIVITVVFLISENTGNEVRPRHIP